MHYEYKGSQKSCLDLVRNKNIEILRGRNQRRIYLVYYEILTVCYYHVMYGLQSESTLFSLPECQGTPWSSKRHILSLSDSNGIRTNKHLVRERTLNHLIRTKWLLVRIPLLSPMKHLWWSFFVKIADGLKPLITSSILITNEKITLTNLQKDK